jgi:hypothetical protein
VQRDRPALLASTIGDFCDSIYLENREGGLVISGVGPVARSTMTVRRRQILAVIGAFFVGATLDSSRSIAETVLSPLEQTALNAFLDVLLPRDGVSGSASDLGVPDELREIARLDPRFRRLLALGCRWLDLTGGPPFGALPIAQQTAVVEWMAQSDWNEVPRRFLRAGAAGRSRTLLQSS